LALPTLQPVSQTSAVILPETGSAADVLNGVAFGVYSDPASPLYSADFISGAVDQVKYVYRKLGGDVVDIELTPENVYAAFEEATLEYSSIINSHQAKNILYLSIGGPTGSFDHDGLLKAGYLSSSLSGSHISLKYPRFRLAYSRRIAKEFSGIASLNGYDRLYSGSVDVEDGVQDYDLQAAISASAAEAGHDYSGLVGDRRIEIKKVYYKTPAAMWKFFGMYGGLNVVGNLASYGQYADDSTFEIVPVWQNRLQAAAYEEAIYVRGSHFTYELRDNHLRIFPKPNTQAGSPTKFWFEFMVQNQFTWDDDGTGSTDGVNNFSTLPLAHLPFDSINSIGKNWIKRMALALLKEVLAHVRGKFGKIPIPGNDITLNYAELYAQSKEEQKILRDELVKLLDELVYSKLNEQEANLMDNIQKTLSKMPMHIYRG